MFTKSMISLLLFSFYLINGEYRGNEKNVPRSKSIEKKTFFGLKVFKSLSPINWLVPFIDNIINYQNRASGNGYSLEEKKFGDMFYHYIVVGGGTSGSVVASRLSENATVKVLLLEEGGQESGLSQIPMMHYLEKKSRLGRSLASIPQKSGARGMENGALKTWMGHGIGGISSFNDLVYNRGHPRDYERWREAARSDEWNFERVRASFLKSEGVAEKGASNFDEEFHSKSGPFPVSGVKEPSYISSIFLKAIEKSGYAIGDYNGEDRARFDYGQSNVRDGERCSTGKAYLGPASKRPNLDVITEAQVTRVVFDDDTNTAIGVEYEKLGKTLSAMASKEVIISAGTFGSPKLLMLSGIGPRMDLELNGIRTRVNCPGVGQNLQYHPETHLYFTTREGTSLSYLRPNKYVAGLRQYEAERRGIFSQVDRVTGFIKTNYSRDETPDISMSFYPLSPASALGSLLYGSIFGYGQQLVDKYFAPNSQQDAFEVVVNHLKPLSKGFVRLNSNNHKDDLLVDHQIYSVIQDLGAMVEGCKKVDDIINSETIQQNLKAKPFKNTLPGCKEFAYGSDQYFACLTQTITFDGSNTCCTCKMGDDRMAVVDHELKVYGTKNLRVIDASIAPEITSGSKVADEILIAERGSDFIRALL